MEKEKENFKEMLINMLKEAFIKILQLSLVFGFYYLMIFCWLKTITYLIFQFPDRKQDLNYLGVFGLGYVIITFFLYMIKTFDKKEWTKEN